MYLISQLANTNALKIKHALLPGGILLSANVPFMLIIQKASFLLTIGFVIKKVTQIDPHTICATLRKEAKLLSW
jgi:hypothetical protein